MQLIGISGNHSKGTDNMPTLLSDWLISGLIDSSWATKVHLLWDNGKIIAMAIQQGEAKVVMDRSLKNNHGILSFVLEGTDLWNRILGVNVMLGHPNDQSPLRSELSLGFMEWYRWSRPYAKNITSYKAKMRWEVTTLKPNAESLTLNTSFPLTTPIMTWLIQSELSLR